MTAVEYGMGATIITNIFCEQRVSNFNNKILQGTERERIQAELFVGNLEEMFRT